MAALLNRAPGPGQARRYVLSFVALVLSAVHSPHALGHTGKQKPVIVGYVFAPIGVAFDATEIAAEKMTRINYAFFRLQEGAIAPRRPDDTANLLALHALKARNPTLEIVISVGGGGTGSAGFSDMALTAAGRKHFIDSAVEAIERYQLDGIDLDWEYPGYTHSGFTVRPEDKENYTRLLKELRRRLNGEEKRLRRHLVTSSATGATAIWLEHTNMREASKWLDSVNMMCYDWYTETAKNTGHDSPLYTNPDDPKAISIDASVKMNLAAGVPAHKLVIGVPFYGRQWTGVVGANHGLWQPTLHSAEMQDNTLVYGKIAPLVNARGFIRYWDPVAKTPFLYNEASKTFVTYNDAEAEQARALYVNSHHLGGIMFWQYWGDPNHMLLDAINAGLSSGAK